MTCLFSLVFSVGLPGTAFPPESCLLDFGILTWEVVRKHSLGWSESNVSCLSPTLFSCRRTRDGKGEREMGKVGRLSQGLLAKRSCSNQSLTSRLIGDLYFLPVLLPLADPIHRLLDAI